MQILIPITETDLYKNWERLFEDLAWVQKLHEVFVEQYTRNMYICIIIFENGDYVSKLKHLLGYFLCLSNLDHKTKI